MYVYIFYIVVSSEFFSCFIELCSFKYSYQMQIIFKRINLTFTVTTTSDQSGPGSGGNEGVLHTPQDLNLTIRCSLVSYPGHSLFIGRGSYFSADDIINVF